MQETINTYKSIDLHNMDSVKLMNRIDTKYIVYSELLPRLINEIKDHYMVLEMGSARIFPYQSLYYDTTENHMYLAHHNGRVNRYKIRFRKYVQSGDCFLEIKRKIKGVRTIKRRMEVNSVESSLSERSAEFIAQHAPFDTNFLLPRIHTNFSRITLVSNALNERVTIDMGLSFKVNSHEHQLQKIAIIELKRSGHTNDSKLIEILNYYGVNAKGFSKYCIGRALLERKLKSNNFKNRILTINKITDGNFYYRNYS